MKGSTLRLTKIDDEIYEHLCKDFPEFDPAETIDENKLKSPVAKKRWRDFMMAYEKKVDDYSFGTMLRSSPKEEYTQHGTIFGKSTSHCSPRFQRLPGLGFMDLSICRHPYYPRSQSAGSLFLMVAQASEKSRTFDQARPLSEQMLTSNSASYAVLCRGDCKKPKRTERLDL